MQELFVLKINFFKILSTSDKPRLCQVKVITSTLAILAILHLGLLRMFLPSTDMIWWIFFSLELYLFCSVFSASLLSLTSSASFSYLFFFSGIYLLLSSFSFFLLLLCPFFSIVLIYFALLLCCLLICFTCSFYKLLLPLPILFLSHHSNWISCLLCYIARQVL